MRYLYKAGVFFVGVVVGILWCKYLVFIVYEDRPIKSFLFWDDTIYGPDYSENNFYKVKPGMTLEEVKSLIGCLPGLLSSGIFPRFN